MQFEITVSVEVERTQGKFASRSDMEEKIVEAVDGANPGNLEGDEGGEYEVTTWEVNATEQPKKAKATTKKPAGYAGWMGLAVPEVEAVVTVWARLKAEPNDEATQERLQIVMDKLQAAVEGTY